MLQERRKGEAEPIEKYPAIKKFEQTTQLREATIAPLMGQVDAAYKVFRDAMEAAMKNPEYATLPQDQQPTAWTEKFYPPIAPLRAAWIGAKGVLRHGLEEHYRLLEAEAAVIPVPEGKYTAEVVFSARGELKTCTMPLRTWEDETLAELLGNIRGMISMEGLHNFGYAPDNGLGFDEVVFSVHSDRHFDLTGSCWVDRSGHIVKTLRN